MVVILAVKSAMGDRHSRTQHSYRPRREPIPRSVKMYVWQRDGGRCVECGSGERLEYDHIIPLSKGGSNTARNIQLLCERCNRRKGARII
jgi:5-methylcytosine-specific restriction endonuclease McrA